MKIDRTFLTNLSERGDYVAVVNAIISLAKHLGMRLIAEGVETQEQVALLKAMDCGLAQGYLFLRPAFVADAEAFIERRNDVRALAA